MGKWKKKKRTKHLGIQGVLEDHPQKDVDLDSRRLRRSLHPQADQKVQDEGEHLHLHCFVRRHGRKKM